MVKNGKAKAAAKTNNQPKAAAKADVKAPPKGTGKGNKYKTPAGHRTAPTKETDTRKRPRGTEDEEHDRQKPRLEETEQEPAEQSGKSSSAVPKSRKGKAKGSKNWRPTSSSTDIQTDQGISTAGKAPTNHHDAEPTEAAAPEGEEEREEDNDTGTTAAGSGQGTGGLQPKGKGTVTTETPPDGHLLGRGVRSGNEIQQAVGDDPVAVIAINPRNVNGNQAIPPPQLVNPKARVPVPPLPPHHEITSNVAPDILRTALEIANAIHRGRQEMAGTVGLTQTDVPWNTEIRPHNPNQRRLIQQASEDATTQRVQRLIRTSEMNARREPPDPRINQGPVAELEGQQQPANAEGAGAGPNVRDVRLTPVYGRLLAPEERAYHFQRGVLSARRSTTNGKPGGWKGTNCDPMLTHPSLDARYRNTYQHDQEIWRAYHQTPEGVDNTPRYDINHPAVRAPPITLIEPCEWKRERLNEITYRFEDDWGMNWKRLAVRDRERFREATDGHSMQMEDHTREVYAEWEQDMAEYLRYRHATIRGIEAVIGTPEIFQCRIAQMYQEMYPEDRVNIECRNIPNHMMCDYCRKGGRHGDSGCHWASACRTCQVNHPHPLRHDHQQANARVEAIQQNIPRPREGANEWTPRQIKVGDLTPRSHNRLARMITATVLGMDDPLPPTLRFVTPEERDKETGKGQTWKPPPPNDPEHPWMEPFRYARVEGTGKGEFGAPVPDKGGAFPIHPNDRGVGPVFPTQ